MPELIDLALAPADLAGVEDLLTSLEEAMPFLVSLTAEEVKALFKLGPQSEAFVQKTIEAAGQHARLLPPNTPLSAMQRDMELREALRPLRARVAALLEKLDGTMILAGADLMKSASAVYRTLRIHGKGEGIEELLEDLGKRFAKRRKRAQAEPPAAQAPVGSVGSVAVEAVTTAPAAPVDVPVLAASAPLPLLPSPWPPRPPCETSLNGSDSHGRMSIPSRSASGTSREAFHTEGAEATEEEGGRGRGGGAQRPSLCSPRLWQHEETKAPAREQHSGKERCWHPSGMRPLWRSRLGVSRSSTPS